MKMALESSWEIVLHDYLISFHFNFLGGASPVFTTTSPATTPTNKHDMDYGRGPWTNIRLPSYFMPHHYDLELVVNLDKLIFSGNVVVNVSLSKETPYMYLHSNKLNISNPKLWKDGKFCA